VYDQLSEHGIEADVDIGNVLVTQVLLLSSLLFACFCYK
jgi:hypothetical protein